MKNIDLACIIDDDPIFVFGAQRFMKVANFCKSLMIFGNGKEALEVLLPRLKAGENIPEVILLDINMPVMNGWEFLDEFVKVPVSREVTIYVVSSSIDPRDISRVKEYEQVSNYIIKPVTSKVLNEILLQEA